MHAKSTFTILDDVIYLDLNEEMGEPAWRQLTDCIRSLKPTIDGAAEDFGIGTATAALIAVAVSMAIDNGDIAVVADTLRQNAEMLDVEPKVGPIEATA